jgi:exonuclease SbcD
MKLLHTSDWHVGKLIRGNSRADEHRAVLAEIVAAADEHQVDLVIVAGDLFETGAPGPESERIVYEALLALARTGAEVLVIAGNHDNAHRLRAVTTVFELARVHLVAEALRPDAGGVRVLDCRSGGQVRVAALPFISQRGIVRIDALMRDAAFEHAQAYAQRLGLLLGALAAGFEADLPNVLVTHGFVHGGQTGGGERQAHLADEYQISPQSISSHASYVALGHLHRPQVIAGPAPIHYCGSPLQLDFGETDQDKQVNVVELAPGTRAKVTPVPLTAGRPLRIVSGSLEEIESQAAEVDPDAWLRVDLVEARRAGLADVVRELLGDRVVDVRILSPEAPVAVERRSRRGRSPIELFAEYCEEEAVADERIGRLFAELYEEASADASGEEVLT